ncbi:MAG: T9SS type A sorting domain-containing protein [Saprospiraceae bacterium]
MKKNHLFLMIGMFLFPTILSAQFSISGKLKRHNENPVPAIEVDCIETVTSDSDGNFEFTDVDLNTVCNILPSGMYEKFDDITILDLIETRRYILNLNSFNFYQKYAADLSSPLNSAVGVTTYDLALMTKLALHIDDNNLPTWTFVDANYNSFVFPLPIGIDVNVTDNLTGLDFVAIKKGDPAISSDYMPAPASAPSPVLSISNEYFQIGDDVEFIFSALNFTNIIGFQETFEWDANLLELEEVIDFQGNNILEDLLTNSDLVENGFLPHLFYNQTLDSLGYVDGSPLMTLKFKALADAPIAQTEVLKFSDQFTPRQIVWENPDDNELYILEGEYVNGETTTSIVSAPEGLEVFQVFPNPVEDNFYVKALLQNAEDVEISIVNVLGQPVFSKKINEKELLLEIDFSEFSDGTYFLSLRTADGIQTESFVKK